MLRLFFSLFLAISLLLASCSSKPSGPTSAQIAAKTAELYYGYLLKGDYGAFVDGRYQPNSIPESYRQQLIDNAKMFLAQQKQDHKGIASFSATEANADTLKASKSSSSPIVVANVFLNVAYGDSSHETIVVPMIQKGGVWLMR